MTTRPRRTDTPAQGGLWGPPQSLAEAAPIRPYVTTNDVELVAWVVRSALEPGYVVVGAAQRVLLRDRSRTGCAESVPRFEADAVAQLLDRGLFRLGDTELVHDGQRDRPARSVLVTAATRALLARWAARRPQSARGGR
jgi:hypothetical protein